jgi:hypothetical protein
MDKHSNLLILNSNNDKKELIPHEKTVSALAAFKATENKNDPARMLDIHGPYEELTLRKTGKLPAEYYDYGDETPWGLRVLESRSNILWQVLSGAMDKAPDFAAYYMALALDSALSDDDYAKELKKLNKDWGDYQFMSHLHGDHTHTSMSHVYGRVACPACSMLTALSVRDKGMNDLFKELIPLSPKDRKEYLSEKGLLGLLDKMIPDQAPTTNFKFKL